MSYEQDYIKRAIEKLGALLARALGLGKVGSVEEGLQVLEQGMSAELGLPFAMLLRLSPQSAISLLGVTKAAAFAEAVRTRALLFELGGRPEDARACAAQADAIAALVGAASSRR